MFKVRFKILFLCMFVFIQGCSQSKSFSNNIELQVLGGEDLTYQCEGNQKINVKYYSLSDSSLYFVKLYFPNEPEITLPSVLSASGVSYSNGVLEWSEKGGIATVNTLNQDKQRHPLYVNCKNL